ncbi:MAG TPA: hypothetical protein V6C64_09530 [Microcoleaceae cyanobacterium]
MAIGLYTQLLFGLVAIAQALYVMLLEQVWLKLDNDRCGFAT